MLHYRSLLIAPVIAIALVLGACDNHSPSDKSGADTKASQSKPGPVITLDNGIRYSVLKPGHGRAPGSDDYVTIHYRVYNAKGKELADSRQAGAPQTYRMKDTMPGWRAALSLMHQGAVWRVTLPPDLAYGKEGLGDVIGPNEKVTFEMALLKVETKKEFEARRLEAFKKTQAFREANAAYLEKNAKRNGVTVTPSGLQYEVLQDGGGPRPKASDTVRVNYKGTLIDGTQFDSSYARGKPAEFRVGGVIKGWQEALQLMNVGSKYRLVIPADLAYGNRGAAPNIKPGATLVFEVELLDIVKGKDDGS